MHRISEAFRNSLWRGYRVAFDRSCYIVARIREGFIKTCSERLMLDVAERCFFELDYPVLTCLGLHDHDSMHVLGTSLSCARAAPLGRAVTRLQRRFRFRDKAQRALRQMFKQRFDSVDIVRLVISYVGADVQI